MFFVIVRRLNVFCLSLSILINGVDFFSLGMDDWLNWNLISDNNGMSKCDWPFFFRVPACCHWKDRNSLVFSKKSDISGALVYMVIREAKSKP